MKVLIFIMLLVLSLTYAVKRLFNTEEETVLREKRDKKSSQSSHFSEIHFFATKSGRPHLELSATETEWDPDLAMQIHENPNGIIVDDHSKKLYYSADSGLVNEKVPREILLKSRVRLRSEDSKINADEMQFLFKNEFFIAKGNVESDHRPDSGNEKILIKSDKLEYRHGQRVGIYSGNVRGEVKRKKAYETGVNFSSLEMRVDLNKSHVELKQNVTLRKQRLIASALHGEIFLENYNKKLKYYRLYDDVKVKETILLRNGKTVERRAFAEKLEGFNQTDKIVLTGSPKVIQDKEIIKGNKISLTQNNEVIEVDDANSKFIIKQKGMP
jgi:lipopolysaccharide export system protein LptA